jgi:meiotic recombination protein DMC1
VRPLPPLRSPSRPEWSSYPIRVPSRVLQPIAAEDQGALRFQAALRPAHACKPSTLTSRAAALHDRQGLSEAKVEKLKEVAVRVLPSAIMSATEVSDRRKSVVRISTGSKAVDAVGRSVPSLQHSQQQALTPCTSQILGGGISTQSVTEVYGEFRTGKTQLAHTMAITSQLPIEMGGGAGSRFL